MEEVICFLLIPVADYLPCGTGQSRLRTKALPCLHLCSYTHEKRSRIPQKQVLLHAIIRNTCILCTGAQGQLILPNFLELLLMTKKIIHKYDTFVQFKYYFKKLTHLVTSPHEDSLIRVICHERIYITCGKPNDYISKGLVTHCSLSWSDVDYCQC